MFIVVEGAFLFVIVFRERTKLFPAIVDVICFSLYGIFILNNHKNKFVVLKKEWRSGLNFAS